MPEMIDPHELNASIERFIAHTVRGVLEEVEYLGVADDPAMVAIPQLRAYLRRYDAAVAVSEQEDCRRAPRLRLVG